MELESVTKLTPFAARFRYEDESPIMTEVLHWDWVKDCVDRTLAWAEPIIRQHGAEGPW